MKRRAVTHVPRTVPPWQLRRTLEAVRRFRTNFVFGTLLVLFALLLGRLAKLQIVEGDGYRQQADRRHTSNFEFQARRGSILDRGGWPLANSRPARLVWVDPHPSVIKDVRVFALQASAVLGGDPAPWQIRERIEHERAVAAKNGKPVRRYKVLRKHIEDPLLIDRLDVVSMLSDTQLHRRGLFGIRVEREEIRSYPNETYAAHVVGEVPYDVSAGRVGIEGRYNGFLSGKRATIPVFRDGRRRLMAANGDMDRSSTRGGDVRLTIDLVIQHFMEAALDRVVGDTAPVQLCGIVLDPRTGEVLALANRPTFDPNREPAKLNFAIQERYEVGSVFKPITVAWALEHGVVKADEEIFMPLVARLEGEAHDIHDDHFIGRGTVVRLIAESSNTGAAKLAHRLGREGMRDLWLHLGLTNPTGIDLPNERGGRLAPDVDGKWPWWWAHRAAYGNAFAITPMQLICSIAAIARDDARVVRPTLILRRKPRPCTGPRLCDPRHLAVVREGMRQCVLAGTARHQFRGARYAAAAKTGTAVQREGRADFNICSLAAFAPFEDPCVVVLVMGKVERERRKYGAQVAAASVREVIERTLAYWNVAPSDAGIAPTATLASPAFLSTEEPLKEER